MNHHKNTNKDPLEKKLFFSNEMLARSQINLNKQNNSKAHNSQLQKNYYSLCEDSSLYLKQIAMSKITKNNKNKKDCNQESPGKNLIKTRRCKSTRRNLLSCKQILQIAKKRETFSAASMDHISSRITMPQKGQIKKETDTKKNKKKRTNSTNREKGIKNGADTKQVSQFQKKNKQIPIQYPLSQSNSYIVFSEKDTSAENTLHLKSSKRGGFVQKSIQQANKKQLILEPKINMKKKKFAGENEKKQRDEKKRSWAATIIQKNWRGYLTRKLLQQYINKEETRVVEALSEYHSLKLQDEEFLAETKKNEDTFKIKKKIEEENGNSLKSMIRILGIEKQIPVIPSLNQAIVFDSHQLFSESSIRQSHSIPQEPQKVSKISSEQSFTRKMPILNGTDSEFLQSLSQIKASNENNRSQSSVQEAQIQQEDSEQENSNSESQCEYYKDGETGTQKMLMIPLAQESFNKTKEVVKPIISKTKITEVKKSRRVKPQTPTNQRGFLYEPMDDEEPWQSVVKKCEQKITLIFHNKAMQAKNQLTKCLKMNQLQFMDMLKARQKLNTIMENLKSLMNQFSASLLHISKEIVQSVAIPSFKNHSAINDSLPAPLQNVGQQISSSNFKQSDKQKQQPGIQVKKIKTMKLNLQGPIFSPYVHSHRKSNSEKNSDGSPISEFYTLEMPTQELSPHKQFLVPLGLKSLQGYLQDIYNDYKELCAQTTHNQNQEYSETAHLCQILKKHSEIGPENMVERCFIQLVVDILTGRHKISDVLRIAKSWDGENEDLSYFLGQATTLDCSKWDQYEIIFTLVKKWTKQLNKWELCPIQEVPRNLEESLQTTNKKSEEEVVSFREE